MANKYKDKKTTNKKNSKAKKAIIATVCVGAVVGGTVGGVYLYKNYKASINDFDRYPIVDIITNKKDDDMQDNNSNNKIDNSINNDSSSGNNSNYGPDNNNYGPDNNNSGATETPNNPGEEIQAPVEKTDEEYKVEFENKIKELAELALERDYSRPTYQNINIKKINAANGKVYLTADKKMTTTVKLFSELDLGVTLEGTVKENYEKVNSLELEDVILSSNQSVLEGKVEDAQFKSLCDYVLNQVGLDGAEVLNATQFASVGRGMRGTKITAILKNKIYCINANGHSGDQSTQEGHLTSMLNSSLNEISIASEEKYVDYNNFIETENSFYFTNQPMSFSERADSLIDWEEDKIEITFFGNKVSEQEMSL